MDEYLQRGTSLTGTNFQYHFEGDFSGDKENKLGRRKESFAV